MQLRLGSFDRWGRWVRSREDAGPYWHRVSAVIILGSLGVALASSGAHRLPLALLGGILLALFAPLLRGRPFWVGRPAPMAAYLLSMIAVALLGSFFHPILLSAAGCLTAQMFALLPL